MRVLANLLAIGLGISTCACTGTGSSTSADRALDERSFGRERSMIQRLRVANNAAIAARDVTATMGIAADDYVLVAGSDTIYRSAEAMRAGWAESFADSSFVGCNRVPTSIRLGERAGILRAAESGEWRCTSTTGRGEAQAFGSYFAHWSRRSGEWRVVSDNYVTLGCRGPGC